jgi:hypothetical protein
MLSRSYPAQRTRRDCRFFARRCRPLKRKASWESFSNTRFCCPTMAHLEVCLSSLRQRVFRVRFATHYGMNSPPGLSSRAILHGRRAPASANGRACQRAGGQLQIPRRQRYTCWPSRRRIERTQPVPRLTNAVDLLVRPRTRRGSIRQAVGWWCSAKCRRTTRCG